MDWLRNQFQSFYNFFIGNVTPMVKSIVLISLLVGAIVLILMATKGKSDIVFKKWLPFFFAIVCIVFACLYMYWTR